MGKKGHGDYDAGMAQLHTKIDSLKNEVKKLTEQRDKAVHLLFERDNELALSMAIGTRLKAALDAQAARTVQNLKAAAILEAMLEVHHIDPKTGRSTVPDFDYALAG